jgi:hypothetical protein
LFLCLLWIMKLILSFFICVTSCPCIIYWIHSFTLTDLMLFSVLQIQSSSMWIWVWIFYWVILFVYINNINISKYENNSTGLITTALRLFLISQRWAPLLFFFTWHFLAFFHMNFRNSFIPSLKKMYILYYYWCWLTIFFLYFTRADTKSTSIKSS